MVKPRYDETQLKSHPRRNRKQNELVKAMLKHLDLMLGENHAGELLAVFVELLKRAVNETPDGRFELRSVEIILNDYFHAKNLADGAQFKIDMDHKKLKAFEIIKREPNILSVVQGYQTYDDFQDDEEPWLDYDCVSREGFDLLKEVLK